MDLWHQLLSNKLTASSPPLFAQWHQHTPPASAPQQHTQSISSSFFSSAASKSIASSSCNNDGYDTHLQHQLLLPLLHSPALFFYTHGLTRLFARVPIPVHGACRMCKLEQTYPAVPQNRAQCYSTQSLGDASIGMHTPGCAHLDVLRLAECIMLLLKHVGCTGPMHRCGAKVWRKGVMHRCETRWKRACAGWPVDALKLKHMFQLMHGGI
eukprot:1161793-Pelagomonas_calceolata.AAC.3